MNVVITGAAGGIGRACVEMFQAEGAHVTGVDIASHSVADEHVVLDLSDAQCGEDLARSIGDRRVDILVNNAAYVDYATALATETATWDRTMAVNLRAPFLVAKSLHPRLQAVGGSVVNISSVHALATSPEIAAYAAAKGGLVSLTRALALEWAPDVRVNCVLPGSIDTEMLEAGLFRTGSSVDELGQRHPMRRVGHPTEIAEAVMFLTKSGFITGASLVVDGGATARLSIE
jgi:NAD(P)-dependent dehydrogenase (short-subunit alcohol dehydrogenase family)